MMINFSGAVTEISCENQINNMVADDLAPCIPKASAAMELIDMNSKEKLGQ